MVREPELNSLDRYVKSSPQFVLEEHGHCEVPAGCGGVVLRWRDRFTSVPLQLSVAIVGSEDWDVRIDGLELMSVRPLLAPGRHVFMAVARAVVATEFAFLVWATSPDVGDAPLLWTPGAADTWRASGVEPGSRAWMDPDADVSTWNGCLPGEVAQTNQAPYAVRRTQSLGAQPLTVDPAVPDDVAPRLWLRAVFEIPAAQ